MADTTLRELPYGKDAHLDPVACIEGVYSESIQTVAACQIALLGRQRSPWPPRRGRDTG